MPARPDPPADPGAAFARLFAKHHPDLFGYVFSLVPRWADADDILQETAVKLWEGFGKYRPGTSFVAWACTVAYYQVLEYRRKRGRWVFDPELLDQLAADAGAVAEEADDRRDALRECLGRLPSSRRRLLELVYTDGGSAADAATELGRPLTSVYAGLSQARKQLRECVNERLDRATGGGERVAAAVAGLTAGGDAGRLAGLLTGADARRAYAELMHDTVGLRRWAGVQRPPLRLAGDDAPPRRPEVRWPWFAGGGAMAAAVAVGLGLLLRPQPAEQARRPDPPPEAPRAEPVPPAVATLVAAAGAEWADAVGGQAGERLPGGQPRTLHRGTATVRLDGGAELVVQGPATFVPEPDGTLTLRTGAVTATAVGRLTVRTPFGELVAEPESEFAARATAAGAEAHVLTGAVTAGGRRVAPLAAVALTAAGAADHPFDVSRFPAPGALDPARPVVEEFWLNVRDDKRGGLEPLRRLPAFQTNQPDGRTYRAGFEFKALKGAWEHYGARLTATLRPPTAGLYTFRVAADDQAEVRLAGKLVAAVPSHTPYRDWGRFPKQLGEPVWLEPGRPVRVEVLYLQRSLASHLTVGWTLPDGTSEVPIPAARLVRPDAP